MHELNGHSTLLELTRYCRHAVYTTDTHHGLDTLCPLDSKPRDLVDTPEPVNGLLLSCYP